MACSASRRGHADEHQGHRVVPGRARSEQARCRCWNTCPIAALDDGMEKQRFLILPTGKKIDNSNPSSGRSPRARFSSRRSSTTARRRSVAPDRNPPDPAATGGVYEFFVYSGMQTAPTHAGVERHRRRRKRRHFRARNHQAHGRCAAFMVNGGSPSCTRSVAERVRQMPRAKRDGGANVHRFRRAAPQLQAHGRIARLSCKTFADADCSRWRRRRARTITMLRRCRPLPAHKQFVFALRALP